MGSKLFAVVLALAWVSRWRKASKCKRLIRRLKKRIGVLRNRRNAFIRQARSDVAQLLRQGKYQLASSRVEELHRDKCRLATYNQLEGFAECILTNLSHFDMQPSMFSDEAKEGVSTMIYASTRCGELPELHSLRDLFKHIFGQEFERTNVKLLPGNIVNSQTKQNLTRKPAMEDIKLQLINEIANEFQVPLGPQLKDEPEDLSNGRA